MRVEVPGRVTEVVAEKGHLVEAGAVLLRIDAEDRPQRLSEAKARQKQREIAYDSAKKLSKGGYSSQLNVAQAKADLEAARALVTRMQRDLNNTTIVAPFTGVVDTLPVEQGDYFDKAGQIAARMLDLTSVKGVGEVTERDIGHVALGKPAQVRLPSGRVLDGEVTYVAQSSAALTRTFPVEVTVQVADGSVAEGLTAEITLPLESVIAHRISPALL
ncbi:efflux RND transporter periplasmic adaptor subunit, partial [Pseudomonadota bacterium]